MNKAIVFDGCLRNSLGLIRSLGVKGVPVVLFWGPGRKDLCSSRLSRYIVTDYYLSSLDEGLDVLRRDYWDEPEKPVLFCASDASICLLDKHYDELKNRFSIFNAYGEQGRINYFMEKLNTFPLAEQSGFSLIRTWHVIDKRIPEDIVFPCLIKGDNSTTSTKAVMAICRDREQLEQHLLADVHYLVQEYVDKEYELDIVGFSYNHGKDVFVPAVIRKIRDDIRRQSVYIRLDDIRDYPNLKVETIQSLVAAIGYEGIFSVELLYFKRKYYFLEINLRSDACGYLYSAAGINYPYLWYKYNTVGLAAYELCNVKFKHPCHLMALHDLYNMLEGKVGIFTWLRQWLFADAHFVLNSKDLRPFFHSFFGHVRHIPSILNRMLKHGS